MIRKALGRHPRGIRVLIVAKETDYIRSGDQIKKTMCRVTRIQGLSVFNCRDFQLEDELRKVAPAICVISDIEIKWQIKRLMPGCEIIIAKFLTRSLNERGAIMNDLEEQLRDFGEVSGKQKSRP